MRTLSTSAQTPEVKHSTESILYGVDFTNLLNDGETLTGTPIATIAGFATPPGALPTTGNTVPPLTVAAPVVNTAPFENDVNAPIAIGAAVQVRISGGLSPTDYMLAVTCPTSAGNTRTVVCPLQLRDY